MIVCVNISSISNTMLYLSPWCACNLALGIITAGAGGGGGGSWAGGSDITHFLLVDDLCCWNFYKKIENCLTKPNIYSAI